MRSRWPPKLPEKIVAEDGNIIIPKQLVKDFITWYFIKIEKINLDTHSVKQMRKDLVSHKKNLRYVESQLKNNKGSYVGYYTTRKINIEKIVKLTENRLNRELKSAEKYKNSLEFIKKYENYKDLMRGKIK